MDFKMKALDQPALSELLTSTVPRSRSSKGGALVDEFLASGAVAATVQFGSTKERNAVALSATNYARSAGKQLWIRKLGGGTGVELLVIDLAKADAATKKAYENRPRVGRRPGSR